MKEIITATMESEGFEWVEIIEPSRRERMFANLKTNQCLWEPPKGAKVKPTHENQWWELYDTKTKRYYYYNATSQKTVWHKPKDGDIIALSKLQMQKAKEEQQQQPPSTPPKSDTTPEEGVINNNSRRQNSEIDIVTIEEVKQLVAQEELQQQQQQTKRTSTSSENQKSDDEEMVESDYFSMKYLRKSDSIGVGSPPVSPEEPNSRKSQSRKSATLPMPNSSDDKSANKNNSLSYSKSAPKKPPRLTIDKAPPGWGAQFKENMGSEDNKVTVECSPETARRKVSPVDSMKPITPPESPVITSEKLDEDAGDYENTPQFTNKLHTQNTKGNKQNYEEPEYQNSSFIMEQLSGRNSNIPPAPPPPPLAPQASVPYATHQRRDNSSRYDNVKLKNKRSVYDNFSEDDSLEEQSSMDMSTSSMGDGFATSDESYTPSGTLLRDDERGNVTGLVYYERLKDQNIDQAGEEEKSMAPKRSPLIRMKSDLTDIEKRQKFSQNNESIRSDKFRPVSMLDVSNVGKQSVTSKKPESASNIEPSLNKHRKGLFRRRMSIHSMLSWSKTPIKKPMVMTRDKQQRKDAIEVFKLILQCMGDKSCRKSFEALAVEITTRGWSCTPLRDEIYVQLCKQTTLNEKPKSLRQGWELLTACLSIFPPSIRFKSYLEGYIYKYMEASDLSAVGVEADVDKYAKFCYKQLERICQTGAKRGLKGPTTDEIQSAIKRVFNPSMFGNTLEDIMDMQAERYPDNRLPWILTTLTDSILFLNGLQTEGIFRVPGDIDGVNATKIKVDRWEENLELKDPNIPASLLKLWFRDLYDPLIPQRFYDQCINNCNNPDICLNIVNSLPPLNNLVFSYLIRLLQAFTIPDNVQLSKMGEDNLAMVWAPNCLRCPSEDPREIFENTRKEMTFLRTVMKYLNTTFLEGIV